MAEASGHMINPSMGVDLRAGHIHRDRQGRSPAPAQSHRPAGRKRSQPALIERIPKRTEAPELPRLRALEAQAASIPISSSAASSTSPRSGSSRVHPYPVGEAPEGSYLKLCPRWLPKLPTLGSGESRWKSHLLGMRIPAPLHPLYPNILLSIMRIAVETATLARQLAAKPSKQMRSHNRQRFTHAHAPIGQMVQVKDRET